MGLPYTPLMDERVAAALVHHQIKEKDVPASAIKKWSERRLSVYIPTIEVIPSGNERKDKERASFFLILMFRLSQPKKAPLIAEDCQNE